MLALTTTFVALAPWPQVGAPTEIQRPESRARPFASEDLNGDGRDDLLNLTDSPSTGGDGWVEVFLSSPGGAFAPPQRLDVDPADRLIDAALVDIDADGDADVIGHAYRTGPSDRRDYFVVWRNDGTGLFDGVELLFDTTSIGAPGSSIGAVKFAAGDLDGDGTADLLVRFVQGPGPFNASLVSVPGPVSPSQPATTLFSGLDNRFEIVQFEDVDDDGDPDLLYANAAGGADWARNDGAGNLAFGHATGLAGGTVYDENGDGFSDLVVVETTTTTVFVPDIFGGPDIPVDVVEKDTCVYYGDGTGPQTPCVLLVPDFGGIPADLDGDGDLDFVDAVKIDPLAPFTAEVRIDVVENLGAGAYSAPLTQAIDPFSFVFGFPFAGDLDGDGVAEVVLGRPAGAIEILGGGAGPIALQPEGYVTASADGLAPPRVVDIDGDGRLDIVTSGSLYELTVGYFQTPAGDFTQGRALVGPRPGTRPDRSAWLDLDLDGDQDLASVKATLDGIDLIENPGSAPFVDLGTVSIAPFRGDVLRTADFEGDGDTDLVFLDVVQDRLGWVENGPGGVFALAATVPTGFDPSAIETGDFNGDGLLDVVVEERGLLGAFVVERPSVYLGAAGGTFAPPVPLVDLPFVDPARFLEALFAVDVDGDGNLDVVRAGNSTGSTFFGEARVDWFKGFGDGTFAPRQLLLTTDTLPLAFEDHDGDGITDLLTRSRGNTQGGTSAFWFRGLGAQSYAPPARLASDADERIQVTTSDLDADGDRDLVVMGFKESYVDVYPFTSRGELGLPYCEQPVANTTGETGRLRASGSAQVSDGSLVLTADRLPPSTFGLFVTGTVPTSNPIANSVGLLCVGGQIGRFVQPGQIQATNAAGEVSLDVDPGALPAGGTVISAAPGATHYFQLWHRDFDAGGAPTSNLTSAVAVLMF